MTLRYSYIMEEKRKTRYGMEQTIFDKYQPNFQLLQKYGFVKKTNYFYYQKSSHNDKFQAQIIISNDQKITGKVIDLDINDEYLPVHSIQTGKFVDEIRNEYVAILKDIRDQCFTLTSIYPQGMQHYWLIPANPKYYDIMNAFNKTDTIIWKQSTKIQVGDIVFIYVGAPVSAIIFACRVLEINIPYQYTSKNLSMTHVISCYLLMGLVGLPVFANFTGGITIFLSPFGGYLIGFFFYIIITKSILRFPSTSIYSLTFANPAGAAIQLLVGTIWIMFYSNVSLIKATMIGFVPFIIPGLVKLYLVVIISRRLLNLSLLKRYNSHSPSK